MARAMRVCGVPGCPEPVLTGKCAAHKRAADQARGGRTERGYGREHRMARAAWLPKIEAGGVGCWRCGLLIAPGSEWDLGHDDLNRAITRGPEHARGCNRAAAGRSAHT